MGGSLRGQRVGGRVIAPERFVCSGRRIVSRIQIEVLCGCLRYRARRKAADLALETGNIGSRGCYEVASAM